MSPIIYLTDENMHKTCMDKLKQLIYHFSAQTFEELLGYFPLEDGKLIRKSLEIMLIKGMIQEKEYIGKKYYYERRYYNNIEFSKYWERRQYYLSSLDFVKMLLNSVDGQGYLLNDIPFIGIGYKPCTIYFQCNGIFRQVYYIPMHEKEFYVRLIQTGDLQSGNITNPENSRIVIVDNDSYLDEIKIKRIDYFAIYNSETRRFILEEGTHL